MKKLLFAFFVLLAISCSRQTEEKTSVLKVGIASSVMTKELKGKSVEEAELIIENFERMINELPYNEEVLGELNIYNEVYKQPSRKKCALLPFVAIKKIVDEDE